MDADFFRALERERTQALVDRDVETARNEALVVKG